MHDDSRMHEVETSIAGIDGDHKLLDRLFRKVERAIFADQPQEEVLALYDETIAAAERHFAEEDKLLGNVGPALRDAHREAHDALMDKAARIRAELAATSGQRSVKALFDIEDALYQHTIAFDFDPLRRLSVKAEADRE